LAAGTTTALYRSFVLGLERRRLQLGWPMHVVDDRAGLQDGYYAKMLHSETPSGRSAGWLMLQLVMDALWPDGAGVRFFGADALPNDELMRERIEALSKRYRKRRRQQYRLRTHLRDYASAKEVVDGLSDHGSTNA
jgi:hypothetical protein